MHEPREAISFHEVGSEDFREAPLYRPPPQIHLEQAILCLHDSLSEKQVA